MRIISFLLTLVLIGVLFACYNDENSQPIIHSIELLNMEPLSSDYSSDYYVYTFKAFATDPDGDIMIYEWTCNAAYQERVEKLPYYGEPGYDSKDYEGEVLLLSDGPNEVLDETWKVKLNLKKPTTVYVTVYDIYGNSAEGVLDILPPGDVDSSNNSAEESISLINGIPPTLSRS